jgi:hypothetical protein
MYGDELVCAQCRTPVRTGVCAACRAGREQLEVRRRTAVLAAVLAALTAAVGAAAGAATGTLDLAMI